MSAPTVFIVDDDPGLRASLAILLQTALMKTECYSSAEDFLGACGPHPEGCVLLDVRMPGMSGPEVHREMARRKLGLPVIFLTGYAELQTGVEAIKQGAVDFLTKPVNGALLIERVQRSIAGNARRRRQGARSSGACSSSAPASARFCFSHSRAGPARKSRSI